MGRPCLVVHGVALTLAIVSCSKAEGPPPGSEVGVAAARAPVSSGSLAAPGAVALSAPSCGGQVPCTLQGWMKTAFAPALDGKDFRSLVSTLSQLAGLAPPGYANWSSIARDGSQAAAVEDDDAVKAACRGCHAQYLDRYKKELHDKAL